MIVLLIKELSQHYSCYKRRVVLSHSYCRCWSCLIMYICLLCYYLFYFCSILGKGSRKHDNRESEIGFSHTKAHASCTEL